MILLQLNICPCLNSLTWCVGSHWHDPCFSLQPWILYIPLPPHMASSRHTELFLSEKGPNPLCPLDLHMWVCLQYFALLWLLKLDRTHLRLSVNIHFCTNFLWAPCLCASTWTPSTEHLEHWNIMYHLLVCIFLQTLNALRAAMSRSFPLGHSAASDALCADHSSQSSTP